MNPTNHSKHDEAPTEIIGDYELARRAIENTRLRGGLVPASQMHLLAELVADGDAYARSPNSMDTADIFPRMVFASTQQDLSKLARAYLRMSTVADKAPIRFPVLHLAVDTSRPRPQAIAEAAVCALDMAFPAGQYGRLFERKLSCEQYLRLAASILAAHEVRVLLVEPGPLQGRRHNPRALAETVFASLRTLNASIVMSDRSAALDLAVGRHSGVVLPTKFAVWGL